MIPVIRYNTPDGEKIVKQILSRSQIENKNVPVSLSGNSFRSF